MFASIPYGIYLQKLKCIPTQHDYITLSIIFIWMPRFQNIIPTLVSFVIFLQRVETNQYYRNPAGSLFHMDTTKHVCIWYDFSASLRWLWTNLLVEIDCVYVLRTSDSKVVDQHGLVWSSLINVFGWFISCIFDFWTFLDEVYCAGPYEFF